MILPLVLAAVPAADHYVYVAAESSDEVYRIHFDGETARVDQRVEVGSWPTEIEGPHGLAVEPDGSAWYVSLAHGVPYGKLVKYSTESAEVLGECELGLFPATMQVSVDTGLLYCVNFDLHGDMSPSSVSIVDPEEMVEVARTEVGPMPHGSRLTAKGDMHYCCSMMADEVIELDAASFEVTRRLRLEDGTGGLTRKGSDGHHVAVTKPTWVQPHPDGKLAYVCLNGAHQVVEIDLKKWEVTRRFPTGRAPYNCEVTPDGETLLVTYKGGQALGIWNLKDAEETARVRTSRRVTHGVVVSTDGAFAFVTSEGIGSETGVVDIIDLETNELVQTVEIGLQAGGIAYWSRP